MLPRGEERLRDVDVAARVVVAGVVVAAAERDHRRDRRHGAVGERGELGVGERARPEAQVAEVAARGAVVGRVRDDQLVRGRRLRRRLRDDRAVGEQLDRRLAVVADGPDAEGEVAPLAVAEAHPLLSDDPHDAPERVERDVRAALRGAEAEQGAAELVAVLVLAAQPERDGRARGGVDGERAGEAVVLAAGAEDLRAEGVVVDERPAGLLRGDRGEHGGGPRHGVSQVALEREARGERGVGQERVLRRLERGVGGVRRGDGALAQRAPLVALEPRLHGRELHAVRVARDAAPAGRAVGRELDAAALREDAGRLHAERFDVDVGAQVEGNRPPDARHAQVVAPGLGEVREVEHVDVLRGVVRLAVGLEAVVRQLRDAAEDGLAVLLAHDLERRRLAEAEGVGREVVVGG